MSNFRNKLGKVLTMIYGYGILLSLFAGGMTFFGYLTAIIIGGDLAEQISVFIFRTVFPVIMTSSTVLVVVGLIKMYITGETALTIK